MVAHFANNEWSEAETERLCELLNDASLSASRIAEKLNREFDNGRSRNAVISKVSRLNLSLPLPPSRPTGKPRRRRRPGVRPPGGHTVPRSRKPNKPLPPEPASAPTSAPVRLLVRQETQCPWPDPGADPKAGPDMNVCGARKAPGALYCQYHLGLNYDKPEARRRGRGLPYLRTLGLRQPEEVEEL